MATPGYAYAHIQNARSVAVFGKKETEKNGRIPSDDHAYLSVSFSHKFRAQLMVTVNRLLYIKARYKR